MIYRVFCDGGARGNPGPAAAAAVIERKVGGEWEHVAALSKFLGHATNNQAEYEAVLLALHYFSKHKDAAPSQIDFVLDSELITNQLKGLYRVKHPALQPLFLRAKNLMVQLNTAVTFGHVGREHNKQADKLVNQTLNRHPA